MTFIYIFAYIRIFSRHFNDIFVLNGNTFFVVALDSVLPRSLPHPTFTRGIKRSQYLHLCTVMNRDSVDAADFDCVGAGAGEGEGGQWPSSGIQMTFPKLLLSRKSFSFFFFFYPWTVMAEYHCCGRRSKGSEKY